MGNRTTGSQGHICYQGRGWRVSVTMVPVRMGVKDMGRKTGHRAHTISLRVGKESMYVYDHCRAIKEALACNNMEIDGKERGLGPSGPRSAS